MLSLRLGGGLGGDDLRKRNITGFGIGDLSDFSCLRGALGMGKLLEDGTGLIGRSMVASLSGEGIWRSQQCVL